MIGVRRAVWPVVTVLVGVGLFFLAVFPTRTYLQQRADRAAVERRLATLAEQNDALESRARLLHTDAEIERLAREQYNLVRPGEEAYAVLPPPDPDAPRPVHRQPDDAVDRAAEHLTSIF